MKNDTAVRNSIGSTMKNQYLRFALTVSLTLTVITAWAQQSEAQLLNKLRGDYGGNTQIQYSPDDTSTRSRLFNLQTGHAGAFYNCDGEEDKRNSPYICWKSGPADAQLHRPILDVLDWRRDKNEIVQRICDGAGACCSGGGCSGGGCNASSNPTSCGCAECFAGKLSPTAATGHHAIAQGRAPVSLLERTHLNSKSQVANDRNVIGLVTKTNSVLEKTELQPEPCNCAQCKAKRTKPDVRNARVATKAPSDKPVAKSRTASLLDRVRSSRKQR